MAIPRAQEREFVERFGEYTRTLDCVHCGLCIPDCPTHGVTGREADSPRGRIYLMRGHAERTNALTREALRHLDECIVCRACETVCPSGIRMGEMIEDFRHEIDRVRPRRGWRHYITRALLRELVPHRHKIAALTDLLWLYQRLGIARAVRWLGEHGFGKLAELDALLPPIPPPSQRRIETDARIPGGLHKARGRSRMRVALFLGCVASEWFAPTHRATIRVLNRAGCDVLVPSAQTCCGALHRHGGFLDEARELHARNAAAFSAADADVLVVNAAGCGAALKEPPPGAPEDLGLAVRDVCELLASIGIAPPERAVRMRVTYDEPCHLVHAQRVGAETVLGLLRQIEGLEVIPLADSDRCCGAGGIYNLAHPEIARPLRDEKAARILQTGAQAVVTGNPGCAMQLRAGLRGRGIDVLHPIDVIDRAYTRDGEDG